MEVRVARTRGLSSCSSLLDTETLPITTICHLAALCGYILQVPATAASPGQGTM